MYDILPKNFSPPTVHILSKNLLPFFGVLRISGRRRGKQEDYNRILDEFNSGHTHSWKQNFDHLKSKGYAPNQAKNAIQVWSVEREIRPRLTRDVTFPLLDEFDGEHKLPKECIKRLMRKLGTGYRSARGHVYQYRKDRGLVP